MLDDSLINHRERIQLYGFHTLTNNVGDGRGGRGSVRIFLIVDNNWPGQVVSCISDIMTTTLVHKSSFSSENATFSLIFFDKEPQDKSDPRLTFYLRLSIFGLE